MSTNDRKWEALSEQLKLSRRDFVFSSLAAGALTLTPRLVSAQAAQPYKIGVLLPSTGTGANYMAHCIKGLPVAIAELNKRGGLLGKHPIEMVYRDTETKPDVGAREAKSLILNDKVRRDLRHLFERGGAGGAGDHPRAQGAALRRDLEQLEDHAGELHALHLPVLPRQQHAVGRGGGRGVAHGREEQVEELRFARAGLRVGPRHAQGLHHGTREDRPGSEGNAADVVQARRDRFHLVHHRDHGGEARLHVRRDRRQGRRDLHAAGGPDGPVQARALPRRPDRGQRSQGAGARRCRAASSVSRAARSSRT